VSRRLALFAVLPVAVLGLAGCGAGSVPADDVASAAAQALQEQVGADVTPDISCPDDLEAEVGASTRCTLTAEGLDGEYGVTVTVNSVDGDKANFDVEVDDQPQG
jgi:hypothetical protein